MQKRREEKEDGEMIGERGIQERQTDAHTDRQLYREKDRLLYRHIGLYSERDRAISRRKKDGERRTKEVVIDKQTDRQTSD